MKTKTLVIILNHNLPEYTDRLYLNLVDFQADFYDLLVMDNGSKPEYLSQFTGVKLERNLYWGGALNEAFRMVLETELYDSLLFLNNDIEVNGEVFVRSLRHELFMGDYAIVSPCIAGNAKPWRQMQNWGSNKTRDVKWVDLQSPLIHRKLIEVIRKFDDALYYGWGQELISSDVCAEKSWRVGVCDHISIVHYWKQTVMQQRLFSSHGQNITEDEETVGVDNFEKLAWTCYVNYFEEHLLKYGTFDDLRAYGESYTFKSEFPNSSSGIRRYIPESILRHFLRNS